MFVVKTFPQAEAALAQLVEMLEEMRDILGALTEEQALWSPDPGDVWPIQRSATHCINCEHRAATELQNALAGERTPQTNAIDTRLFAWHGPTPYALARLADELSQQVQAIAAQIDESHMEVKAVRYRNQRAASLAPYIQIMCNHTRSHLDAIRRKYAAVPAAEVEEKVLKKYPQYGQGAPAD